MRYFIFLSFDGSQYHGWQIQPNAISVQEQLNKSLSLLLRNDTTTIGAGRTDTGVHAQMMVAHFDTNSPIDCAWLADKLNRILPPDIAINAIRPVRFDAHARFDAKSRTYHYLIYREKNPFYLKYATRITFPLDFALMNEAANQLLTFSDFTSFSKLHTDTKTNICRITHAEWKEIDENLWQFEITANRFLRNMVRAIVGTLIEVGRGKLSLRDFVKVINCKNRCAAGESMPGRALSLVNIEYDESVFL